MVAISINLAADPTLDAIRAALEAQSAASPPREYLGASLIGELCARKIWYNVNGHARSPTSAQGILTANDGHSAEEMMAAYLRMVPGIQLWTKDPENPAEQIRFTDGRISGACDGIILGLLQAPKTSHIWEHKSKGEKYFNAFKKLKSTMDEKQVLKNWNAVYHGQAQILMHKFELTRHYLTVSLPGVRDFESCRTEYDKVFAVALLERANRILTTKTAPERIGGKDWHECKWCPFYKECHNA